MAVVKKATKKNGNKAAENPAANPPENPPENPSEASSSGGGKRGRAGRTPRIDYPGLKDGVLLAVPDDFDVDKHAPLTKQNFGGETPKALYWEWKAGVLEKKRDRIIADAEEARHFAKYCAEHEDKEPKSKRSIGKALVKQLEQMNEIRAEIGEIEGIDLDAFLAAAKAMADGKAVTEEADEKAVTEEAEES